MTVVPAADHHLVVPRPRRHVLMMGAAAMRPIPTTTHRLMVLLIAGALMLLQEHPGGLLGASAQQTNACSTAASSAGGGGPVVVSALCSCSADGFTVDCSSRNLVEVPPGLPALLRTLDLSYNRLTRLRAGQLSARPALLSLDVSYNLLADLDSGALAGLPALSSINLGYNRLAVLSMAVFGGGGPGSAGTNGTRLSTLTVLLDGSPAAAVCPASAGVLQPAPTPFANAQATFCTLCTVPGMVAVDGRCQPCAAGWWTGGVGGVGNSSCAKCGPGSYSTGHASTATACAPCSPGSYSAAEAAEACTPCGAGMTTTGPGAINASACACPAGYWAAAGAFVCTPCPAGSWSDTVGAASPAACRPCGARASSTVTAATSLLECLVCDPRQLPNASLGACTFCPAGKALAPSAVNSAVMTCADCAAHNYSEGGGLDCSPCPRGTLAAAPAGATSCTMCPGE